jgi:hypothetical protein
VWLEERRGFSRSGLDDRLHGRHSRRCDDGAAVQGHRRTPPTGPTPPKNKAVWVVSCGEKSLLVVTSGAREAADLLG